MSERLDRAPVPADPPGELIKAGSARREGIHTTLRGCVLALGRPREIVLRCVLVEEVRGE